MESELRDQLRRVFEAFSAVNTDWSASAVWAKAAKDAWFFARIESGKGSFTVKKFDSVMQWFSDNWPEGAKWPEGVVRPERTGDGDAA